MNQNAASRCAFPLVLTSPSPAIAVSSCWYSTELTIRCRSAITSSSRGTQRVRLSRVGPGRITAVPGWRREERYPVVLA
jgi:hypothetical protein